MGVGSPSRPRRGWGSWETLTRARASVLSRASRPPSAAGQRGARALRTEPPPPPVCPKVTARSELAGRRGGNPGCLRGGDAGAGPGPGMRSQWPGREARGRGHSAGAATGLRAEGGARRRPAAPRTRSAEPVPPRPPGAAAGDAPRAAGAACRALSPPGPPRAGPHLRPHLPPQVRPAPPRPAAPGTKLAGAYKSRGRRGRGHTEPAPSSRRWTRANSCPAAPPPPCPTTGGTARTTVSARRPLHLLAAGAGSRARAPARGARSPAPALSAAPNPRVRRAQAQGGGCILSGRREDSPSGPLRDTLLPQPRRREKRLQQEMVGVGGRNQGPAPPPSSAPPVAEAPAPPVPGTSLRLEFLALIRVHPSPLTPGAGFPARDLGSQSQRTSMAGSCVASTHGRQSHSSPYGRCHY